MKTVMSLLFLSAFAMIFGGIFATAANAQSSEGSSLRLEESLEIGDTTLEPGVYMIKVLPGNHRSVLQVTNEDQTKTFATVLAVPHATAATADQERTQYVYFPATEGSGRALRTWFVPASAGGGGYDIVYPQWRAMELATVAKGPVVSYKDETRAEDLKTAKLDVVAADQKVTVYMTPNGEVEPMEEEPMVVAEAHDLPRTVSELPRTASRTPLFVMLGFVLLMAAVGIQIFRTV